MALITSGCVQVSKFPWVKAVAAPGEPPLNPDENESEDGEDGDDKEAEEEKEEEEDDDEESSAESDESDDERGSKSLAEKAWVKEGVMAVYKEKGEENHDWLGKVSMDPDSDNEVKLIWKKNNRESSYIHIRNLEKNPDKEVPVPITLLKEARDIAADDGKVTVESLKFRLEKLEDNMLPVLDRMLTGGDSDWLSESSYAKMFFAVFASVKKVLQKWELPDIGPGASHRCPDMSSKTMTCDQMAL